MRFKRGPITAETMPFFSSSDKANNIKGILMMSLDKEDALRNLMLRGYKLQWRKAMWERYKSYVNQPKAIGATFSDGDVTDTWASLPESPIYTQPMVSIEKDPKDIFATEGDTGTYRFSVEANDVDKYVWYEAKDSTDFFSKSNLEGSDSSELTVVKGGVVAKNLDGRRYQVYLYNSVGEVMSKFATFHVADKVAVEDDTSEGGE